MIVLGQTAFATHNLAGDITYRHIGGLTYEFTVTIFADGGSPAISRRDIEIDWGDNTGIDSLTVVEETDVGTNGEIILKRVWRGTHTFAGGAFTYTIRVIDPNRNAGVVNMDNSVNVPFTIQSTLTVSPFAGGSNNSVQLRNNPLDDACIGARYVYNPGAFDPDGDSLAYRIAPSRGAAGAVAPNYTFPAASTSISVDPVTGDLIWENPTTIGLHNVAIQILEYRNGGIIGSVLRDIQIDVIPGCNNNPPNIFADQLVCVDAGSTLNTTINATDPDVNDDVTLTATGEVLELPILNRTNFNSGVVGNPTNASFIWNTLCEDVRLQPYQLSIKAEDNASIRGSINLVNFRTVNIRVVSPAPKNAMAMPTAKTITLTWTNTDCQNAAGYYIYRRLDSSGFTPTQCVTGVPDGIGYTKIAEVNDVTTTTFIDDDNGDGLVPGQKYCYLITKFYTDGDESYASNEVCAEVEKIVPIITKASIVSTDGSTGTIDLAWSPPQFDNMAFPPPYRYDVFEIVDDVETVIGSTNSISDTTFTVNNRNTIDNPYTYKVTLFSLGNGETEVGKSAKASSIFLRITPTDNLLRLNWEVNVPWNNTLYTVYRRLPGSSTFNLLGSTSNRFYNDSNLVNGSEYCYYIESSGSYNLIGVTNPLLNLSQEACERPVDNVPPCTPNFVIDSDCDRGNLTISWPNLNNTCGNDISGYAVYKASSQDGPLTLIESKMSPDDTVYTANGDSIAGCYVISAIDSSGNESLSNRKRCIEFCPIYELPNVFTPNGDGINDFFVPIAPFRYVDSIEMVIYNRWGEMVFETTDPSIKWNGQHEDIKVDAISSSLSERGEQLSGGGYYYVCKIFETSLQEKEPRVIKGVVTIIDPQFIKETD